MSPIRPIATAAAAAAALLASVPAAGAAAHNHYCSPTGDFCQGVEPDLPKVTLGFTSFPFRGNYELCTRYEKTQAYTCHTYALRRQSHGLYGSDIRFQRHYPHSRRGRYFAQWRQGGVQIGRTVWFRW